MAKNRKEKNRAVKQQRQDRRNSITTGVVFIVLGALFLLNTLDILPYNIWEIILRSWPLLLILLGLHLVVKRTRIWWLTPLLLIALFAVLVYPQYFPHYRYWLTPGRQVQETVRREEKAESSRVYTDEIRQLDINLSIDAGRIDIFSSEEEENLYDLSFHYRNEEREPAIEYNFDSREGRGILEVDHLREFELENMDIVSSAVLELHPAVNYNIAIDSGAGYYQLDLQELMVDNLEINSGISDLKINFASHDTSVRLNSGASNIELVFLEDTGVEIRAEGALSYDDFLDYDLEQVEEDFFRSPNFAEAENQIQMHLISPASNISFEFNE